MYKKIPLLLLVISLGLLSACSTTSTQAPVVERNERVILEPGMYAVKKGDTLIRIALEFGQSHHDLVAWNRLSNPNDIKVDQVLRVLPPDSGSGAGSGAQTSAVVMPPETTPPKRVTPRGEKRLHSDAAQAELPRPDGTQGKTDAPVPMTAKPVVPAAVNGDEKLAWMWPSAGKVVATFDEGKNKGIDIAGKAGQQVIAASAGKVMYAGSGIRGYGNLVIVKHSSSLLSAYAHNRSILVKEGQSVTKGQMIAEMGDSDSDAVKLHFEIRQQGKPVDPSKFLPNR